eukprot:7111166-Prymnesium_polylepis.2
MFSADVLGNVRSARGLFCVVWLFELQYGRARCRSNAAPHGAGRAAQRACADDRAARAGRRDGLGVEGGDAERACTRGRAGQSRAAAPRRRAEQRVAGANHTPDAARAAVSYTHLTLPTICSV